MRREWGRAGSRQGMNLRDIDRGLKMGGLLVAFERLAKTFEPIVDGPFTDKSLGQRIVQREGMIVAGEGFVETVELFEGDGFFYVSPSVMAVEGERFLEADESVAGLLRVKESISRVHQRDETLRDSIGGRRYHNRSRATLDGAQGRAEIKEHGQQAGAQKDSHHDCDVDDLRGLL